MDALKKTEHELNEGKRKLEDMIKQIEFEEVNIDSSSFVNIGQGIVLPHLFLIL